MKEKKFNFLHILIAAIAIANLVLLFLFQYGLSNTTPAVQAAERASKERAAASGSSTEGNSADVQKENETDNDSAQSSETEKDTTSESTSEVGSANAVGTGSAKTNAESGNDSDSEIGESSGVPSISFKEPLPTLNSDDLPRIAGTLADLGYISADDGYGNDITDQITADYKEDASDSSSYSVTFSVTNRAGKTVSETRTITVQAGTKPILELTEESITLPVGANFYYMSYIKTARDVDGQSLDTRISISGVVDTSTRGTYELEYSTISRVTNERVSKTLKIRVE